MKNTDKYIFEEFVRKIYQDIKKIIENDIFFGKAEVIYQFNIRKIKNSISLNKTKIIVFPIIDTVDCYYFNTTPTNSDCYYFSINYNLKGKFKCIKADIDSTKRDVMRNLIPHMIMINSAIDKVSEIIKEAYDKHIIEFEEDNPNINLLT